jgi:murein DD-endopeptidase MepM/ murein hydrolase activator NlpD
MGVPPRPVRPAAAIVVLASLSLWLMGMGLGGGAGGAAPRAATMETEAGILQASPSYYRPAIVDGMAFPVARTNYLSHLAFPNNWHAPRLRLIDGTWELVGVHEGIDISAERGTPILSMTDGVVEATGWTFYSGTRVGIRGEDGRYYFYAHLDQIAAGIVSGAGVVAGEVLGELGNTGYGGPGHRDEFPPHLHLGIEAADGSEWVNPYPTLVSLYEATVRAHERWQSRIDDMATAGKRAAWEREMERAMLRPAA